ncbi:hypothetical protein BTVI_154562 [Pitangus sulphuratus]|nr:hypothetical protein BTVI_154562 [Pitangus sulphuratus]
MAAPPASPGPRGRFEQEQDRAVRALVRCVTGLPEEELGGERFQAALNFAWSNFRHSPLAFTKRSFFGFRYLPMWVFVLSVPVMQVPDNFGAFDTNAFDKRVLDLLAPLDLGDSIL